MNLSTVRGLSRNDILHVPEHIRIDRLTTDSAVRNQHIRGRSRAWRQYAVYEGNSLLFVETVDEVAAELGIDKSMVINYNIKKTRFEGRMDIVRVEE